MNLLELWKAIKEGLKAGDVAAAAAKYKEYKDRGGKRSIIELEQIITTEAAEEIAVTTEAVDPVEAVEAVEAVDPVEAVEAVEANINDLYYTTIVISELLENIKEGIKAGDTAGAADNMKYYDNIAAAAEELKKVIYSYEGAAAADEIAVTTEAAEGENMNYKLRIYLQKAYGRNYMWAYYLDELSGAHVLSGGVYYSEYSSRAAAEERIKKELILRENIKADQYKIEYCKY